MLPLVIVGFFLIGFMCKVLEIFEVRREEALQLAAFLIIVLVPTIIYVMMCNSQVTLLK